MPSNTYTIETLSALTGIAVRTIRYYIQEGLVDRPEGIKRASHYLEKHLEQLLRVKRLSAQGRSLESIRNEMHESGATHEVPIAAGEVRVCSHIHLGPGIELVIDPARAPLRAQEIRSLIATVTDAIRRLESRTDAPSPEKSTKEL